MVPPEIKFVEAESKATFVPSGENVKFMLLAFPWIPLASIDTMVTAPVVKSLMKIC